MNAETKIAIENKNNKVSLSINSMKGKPVLTEKCAEVFDVILRTQETQTSRNYSQTVAKETNAVNLTYKTKYISLNTCIHHFCRL